MQVGFFFVKQKTAYEMRISDWSSDVCSSDLAGDDHAGEGHLRRAIDGIDHDVGLGVDGMALLDQPVEDLVRVAALQQRPVVAPGGAAQQQLDRESVV